MSFWSAFALLHDAELQNTIVAFAAVFIIGTGLALALEARDMWKKYKGEMH